MNLFYCTFPTFSKKVCRFVSHIASRALQREDVQRSLAVLTVLNRRKNCWSVKREEEEQKNMIIITEMLIQKFCRSNLSVSLTLGQRLNHSTKHSASPSWNTLHRTDLPNVNIRKYYSPFENDQSWSVVFVTTTACVEVLDELYKVWSWALKSASNNGALRSCRSFRMDIHNQSGRQIWTKPLTLTNHLALMPKNMRWISVRNHRPGIQAYKEHSL